MRCQSVIKPIICGLYPMTILYQNSFVFKPKDFWILHLNDHLYSKPCVFLWIENFQGFTAGFTHLPTLSLTFIVGHICITKNTEAFTQGGIYPYLLLPDTYFHFHVQPCNLFRSCSTKPIPPNQTPNVVLIITMYTHPCHAMFPCINAI